ncbi:hypothetical protein OGATHE_004023 [Ogataea polymorpha]|uniref:Uncharacterized protein n=1 Tax=Ogataea polymorpha TaxID=460523 RepID=A0A9P8T3S6_9ASCO|nr:hypothetical protein OGATHE_004023 [Ogataea polymorpha]
MSRASGLGGAGLGAGLAFASDESLARASGVSDGFFDTGAAAELDIEPNESSSSAPTLASSERSLDLVAIFVGLVPNLNNLFLKNDGDDGTLSCFSSFSMYVFDTTSPLSCLSRIFIDAQLELLPPLFQILEPKLVLRALLRSKSMAASCDESATEPLDLILRWLPSDPKNLEESRTPGDVGIPRSRPLAKSWSSDPIRGPEMLRSGRKSKFDMCDGGGDSDDCGWSKRLNNMSLWPPAGAFHTFGLVDTTGSGLSVLYDIVVFILLIAVDKMLLIDPSL